MKSSYVLLYLLLLCFVGFLTMGIDKYKAKKGLWRIPEKTIFLIALLGGSGGALLGMHIFRHKTKHWYFRYGLPAILMLQAALLAAFVYWNILLK
jgi:uncharacterized membrane protein YsdA (DUF1294 family)